jgi:dihydroneopterin aldolase
LRGHGGRWINSSRPWPYPSEDTKLDKIFLRGLKVDAVIGVWEWERQIRQTIEVDLELATDVARAAESDTIEAALNYKDIAKALIDFVSHSEFQLVESLAEALARVTVLDFGIAWTKISVSKPGAIEGSREVGVIIERTPADYA